MEMRNATTSRHRLLFRTKLVCVDVLRKVRKLEGRAEIEVCMLTFVSHEHALEDFQAIS